VRGLGGVVGRELVDVQLEAYDARGRLERRLFADRIRIRPEPPGVELVLRDGAIVNGEEKQPFLDGTYRIYLPRPALAEWEAASLPGLGAQAGARATDPARGEAPAQEARAGRAPAAAEGGG
jgi:hypothetical protein